MKGDNIILLWNPKNKNLLERGPSSALEYPDENGENKTYRHYKKEDRWEIEVDRPLASFLLSRMSGDYHLLSPNSLSISIKDGGMGCFKTKRIQSIEPKKKQKAK